MVSCLICIGTNCERERNLSFAINELSAALPGIVFAPAEQTAPIGMTRGEYFTNQVGRFATAMSCDELKSMFKAMERAAGRTPADKAAGIVRLDIDLLTYGHRVLKPADMERHYVVRGISLLPPAESAEQQTNIE